MKILYAIETTKGTIYATFKPALTDNFHMVIPSKNKEEFEEAWNTSDGDTVTYTYSRYYSKCQADCLRKNCFRRSGKKITNMSYELMPYDIFDSLKIDNSLVGKIERRMFKWARDDLIYGEWWLGKRKYTD